MTEANWFGSEFNEPLERTVADELRYLRSRPKPFSAADMLNTEYLLKLLGAGDPHLAYGALREVFDSVVFNNVDVEAARDHMYWPLDDRNSAGRLKRVAENLAIDPRNAVEYSNRGVRLIAKKIVALSFDADADSYTEYGIGIFPASSGRYRLTVLVRAWGYQQPKKPSTVWLNRKVVPLKEGKVSSDSGNEITLEWNLHRKLPAPSAFSPGERALVWSFAMPTYGPPRLTLADELNSRSFAVRFRSMATIVWVEIFRRSTEAR